MPQSSSRGFTLHPEILSDSVHRIHVRIQHKFRQRLIEWIGAAELMVLGIILLHPADSFGTLPAFVLMSEMFTEYTWGWILLVVGGSRLLGLIINGSMEAVTPWIRAAGAVCGFACFATIGFSMLTAWWFIGAAPSTGIAMYVVASCAEVAAIYLAFIDARIYRNGVRNRNA